MLYDSYHKKITKVLKTLRKIFKHIVLISIVTGVLLASLVTFMVIKGWVLDDKALTPSFEASYGDELPLNSSAIFAKCSYEYSEDGETWSSEKPIAPGEYKARAMAKNIFGKLRYGMVYDFVIKPKEIDVSVAENMIQYGDLPTVEAELAYEDKISCEAVTYSDKFASETMVKPVEETVKIKNADGEDVTKNYKLNIVETNITINPRSVTVIISGKEMIYNNTVLSNFDGYELSEDTPAAYDDRPIAVLQNTRIEVGVTPNEPSEIKMVNADGEDVSLHYQISKVVGDLKVSERPLYIKTATDEKAYDDIDLINKTCEVVNEYPIVDGHTLECTSHTSIKYVGEIKNTLVFKVKNEAGEDKTASYSLFYEEGTLKI
ncbi:MAG: hypothetical protein J6U68_02670, partial [Clostridia bacterium]|nr:hypothetical protein [Clostridia bacterium]